MREVADGQIAADSGWRGAGEVCAAFEAANRFNSRVANSMRMYVHSPAILKYLLPLQDVLQKDGLGCKLDASTRALAMIKVSALNECRYRIKHNRLVGRTAGWSEEQLDLLSSDRYLESPLFGEREKAVIRWAALITWNQARYDDAGCEQLARQFDSCVYRKPRPKIDTKFGTQIPCYRAEIPCNMAERVSSES